MNEHQKSAYNRLVGVASGFPAHINREGVGSVSVRYDDLKATLAHVALRPFQRRVQPWMLDCFGAEIAADQMERNHRFFEEATELVQACGMTASEAHQLVDYTFGRQTGEPFQETGGVMVTLAALCLASDLDMHVAGETELARISEHETVAKIRAKQAAKPKHSPLPASIEAATKPYQWHDTGPLETGAEL